VGRTPCTSVSPDSFGYAPEVLCDKLGAPHRDARQPFVGLLANACFGDINNVDVRRRVQQPYPYHQILSVADTVSTAVAEAYRRVGVSGWGALGAGGGGGGVGGGRAGPPEGGGGPVGFGGALREAAGGAGGEVDAGQEL